ncbi:MAG: exosome complex exonuclease RRP4 N-terminal region-domain-containing protein [Olpidium bornovanus]|uniref:Exosome complex exonuclease RRP4 N-terminal region-domain-containing protein n=1 Tax=Olpidium bornovanus TaxID=278681 RepID=A0A8H7ZZX7_9FUNG|nr:MAG: exosome complex exonuclease RRP4 N-terminal region-domain-containing protein [Olpidium bornovanus]
MNVDFLFPQERVFSSDEAALAKVVTPGEHVTSDTAFMRGHGTYADGERVIASVAGTVERVNKLLSVRPVRSRHAFEPAGDCALLANGDSEPVGRDAPVLKRFTPSL